MNYKRITAKLTVGILAANLLIPPVHTSAAKKTFPDVPNWAQQSVNYLVEKKALDGKPDGTFSPSEQIDRGSAAKLLAMVLGLQINKEAKPSFQDAKHHWAAPYIAAVEKAGVIKGDGSGNFNPSKHIDRASMASMLVEAYKLNNKIIGDLPTQFSDLQGHWGEKLANTLVALEISKGTGDGWKPRGIVTRAEAAQFIAQTDMKKADTSKRMYMNRYFITYHQPSLSSGITSNQHAPQIIVVKEKRADGWLKIVTSKGEKWTPLQEKKETIHSTFTTYQEASHSSKVLGTYTAQTVTVIEEKGSWIRIRTNAGFQWVDKNQLTPQNKQDKQNKQNNFLEGKAIIIDPGHGGIDGGHKGIYMNESPVVYDTAVRLQKLFAQKTPFTALLTRDAYSRPGNNSKDSLAKRVEFAQKNKGDIFVSIHANGFNGNAHGTETFYYKAPTKEANPYVNDSRVLAEKIQNRLITALKTRDRGTKVGNLYVLRENTMPSVLTELGFVDNEADGKKLASPEWRQCAAEAIYAGILDYYEWKGHNMSAYY
ncbi:N-acetylmuramoyl-L-alanine amidase [Bacillus cytotoxicus]|uniref:Cell wall hydrolase/autolysin n=1 Tax=Bacillus cytotoxicus TaxID=580165 RepID=A0AAX2CNA6_9BACI|nr:N-acetylmuramoyl-L-alanine amidase [Bacillus cytotoxicus]QTR84118.1 N-acetylmuramoyl-L-alanine amidase [Bacillus cytotoxicus]QTR87854.1 N-acetylmuramoyl-L-alanine amidase [Bacillus cytotoxicus]SCM06490.1 Cell wall hydrolase/autolysin [Bacillus cytotoxicus]